MEHKIADISRVTRTREQARASYDRLSRWYDLLEGFWEERPRRLALKKLQVKEGQRVLEIGFGTGLSLVSLARLVGANGRVYGLDLSPGMLRVAQARVDRAGLIERVELHCGDALRLPFSDEFFDAILASFVLELFDTPEIPRVLCECRRVLRNGGRISAVSLSRQEPAGWMQQSYEWGHEHFPQLLDCRPIPLQRLLEMSGFQLQEGTVQSLWGLPVEIDIARNPGRP